MSETLSEPTVLQGWNRALRIGVCEHCNSSYLLPVALVSLDQSQAPLCPTCFHEALSMIQEGVDQLPYTQPPELFIPFQISADRTRFVLENFAKTGLFQPHDLTPSNLMKRLQRVYLPSWLVDAEVEAQWQAEAGFNYEVVSHQNIYR